MANLNVNPEYDIDMEQLTPETRAHADRFNERYGQLLGNDAFLKGKLEEANTSIERAMAVAQGKSAGLVFNTYAELLAYIAVPANAEKFRLGDQFLIKATDVPDYWWDNTVTTAQTDSAGNVISGKNTSGKVIGALVELEARKIDLSKYDVNDAALFNNMSDQYNSSRTYDVGDICIYNNNLYKCITAVKAAETFNASKWNKTSLAALHAEQEKKISENNQPPTYTEASSLSALTSGEKLSVAFGKIAKAVSTLISHISTKATSSVLGHVKLSDSTSSTSAASTGVAATPKAVKAAYDLANSHTKKLGTTDISSIGDGTVTGAIAVNKEAIEEVNQSLTNLNDSKKTYLRLVLPNLAADAKTVCDYINKNYLLGQLSPAYTVEFDIIAANVDWFSGTLSTDSTALVAGRTVWGIVQQRSISADNSTVYKYFAAGEGGAGSVSPFKSYDQGYAQGVTDADNRANANSTNYKTGYNNGYNAGKSDGALTGVSGCCIAGWRSIDAYSNNQWVSGWTGVNPNYFTVNGYGIVPKRNFTATVYWQEYNKRDIDFYSNGVMGHRDNGTSMNGVKMNFYAGTQCGFKTNDSGGGSLGAGFIVLN